MRGIIKFLQEVRTEFGNISWPKKDSLFQLTFVVISISLIISLILGGFDYLFTQSFNLLGQPTVVAQPTITAPPVNLAPTITVISPTTSIKK
ncbi:preprotein translocase subunit SecE [Candidatus Shapirobacteria bacterium]|nr:preprotein translocase subunit SecE [Candidatus Shapirobacteria bacterium]